MENLTEGLTLETLPKAFTQLANEIIKIKPFHHKKIQKILITDDSSLNRTLLNKVLKSLFPQIEILEASNGEEAINIINLENYSTSSTEFTIFNNQYNIKPTKC